MATKAHCAYCFEALVASYERRKPLSLSQVEDLWAEQSGTEEEDGTTYAHDDLNSTTSRVPALSRLLNSDTPTTNSSSSSLTSPSTQASTPSSRTSLSSGSNISPSDSYPLFVTWNTVSPRSGQKSLRGCIGTFAPLPLEKGLADYALTSAFEDTRFSPIPSSELPRLQCCVTLLTNFSNPTRDIMAWEVGKHGIRISFPYQGRKLGATYLPDVAREQGWTKEEALVSLMRKAGWSGRKDEWRKVAAGMELVTYEGKKVDLEYAEFKQWREKISA
ncbi:hypothetical protein E4T44_06974 [Aureobasidium sp. EXF-8845]|nr:hypothetical protein E4T44_06974 [Aureobasidium sp. EXF-8845]KAI4847053.1 hypothetical protein E4T45_06969 [Aureobasidium sp. EXF-8846]